MLAGFFRRSDMSDILIGLLLVAVVAAFHVWQMWPI